MTTPYGVQILTGELDKLARASTGERNNTLNTVAFRIFQCVPDHIDATEAEQKIYETAKQLGIDSSFTDADIRRTINSARHGGQAKPRANTPDPEKFDQPSQPARGTDEPESSYDHLYVTRSELATLPQPEPLIKGIIDKRSLFSITGRGGTFKSFLGLNWIACVATGHSWLGHEVEQTKVLYIVGEGLYGLDARLESWETATGIKISDDWFHVRKYPVNLFYRGADCQDLYNRIEQEKYGLVIIDTLQQASSGADVNLAKDAGIIVTTMSQLKAANPDHLAIGYVAHMGKNEEQGTRGSTALEDDLDIVWRLTRDDDMQIIRAQMVKRRDGPEDKALELMPQHISGTNSLILQKYAQLPDSEGHPKYTIDVLKELCTPTARDGLSQTALRDALGLSTTSGAGARTIKHVCDWLIDHGYVVIVGRGTKIRYKVTETGKRRIEEGGITDRL